MKDTSIHIMRSGDTGDTRLLLLGIVADFAPVEVSTDVVTLRLLYILALGDGDRLALLPLTVHTDLAREI